MDDETKNALEAVYGKISQLSDDLLGDKDKPGVFEAIRTVTSKIDSQIETVTQMGNDVRRLAWQQVATQNHVKSLTKKYEAWDDRLKRIESAPGQQALNQAETQGYVIETTMKPYKEMDWKILTALNNNTDPRFNISLAFRQLAENADKIGNLNISPELLDSILNNKREVKK